MNVSPQTQAVLLLTSYFSKPRGNDVKPLSPTEWGKFAAWLRHEDMTPEILLSGDLNGILSSWTDRNITEARLKQLLERGSALAIAIEKWLRTGLWILGRSDPNYPRALKARLGPASPPVLFGCGNVNLLNQGGLAVVGSRNTSESDLSYASRLGASAADAGISIISGGARGVDEAAMLGALQAEGTAVGILADSLLRNCSSQKYRPYLKAKNLALVSPYYPEAGFNAGNAMGRNKYIYCLADAALVVHSGRKGGTWTGALENLKKGWAPLWVKPTSDQTAGNALIVKEGAIWAPQDIDSIDVPALLQVPVDASRISEPAGLFDASVKEKSDHRPATTLDADKVQPTSEAARSTTEVNAAAAQSFYELFLLKAEALCKEKPLPPDELADQLEIKKTQINEWLKQAVKEKKLKKLTKPVRYQWQGADRQQLMFSE